MVMEPILCDVFLWTNEGAQEIVQWGGGGKADNSIILILVTKKNIALNNILRQFKKKKTKD